MGVKSNAGRSGRRRWSIVGTAAAIVVVYVPLVVGSSTPANAADTGSGVSYTLEGCRASASVYPPAGPFICPNASYTTGNLGSGWNELDLVPGRVIVSAGNSAPATQTVEFVVAGDNCSGTDGATGCAGAGDVPGFDRMSTVRLNTDPTLSSGTCPTATVSPVGGYTTAIKTGTTSIYDLVTLTGLAQNTSCTYDFYARMAIGSHNFPGSSLHFYATNSSFGSSGIGSKDVPIPVKQVQPFGFSKQESASQGSTVVWTVTKTIDSSPNFANTCDTNESTTSGVNVTVSWTATPTLGNITVSSTISYNNATHRELGLSISDQLYDGASTSLSTALALSPDGTGGTSAPVVHDVGLVNPGVSSSVTDIWNPPNNTETAYSDVATGTVSDPVFGDQVLLPLTWASAAVTHQTTSGATTAITDVEALTDGYDPSLTSSNTTLGSTPASDYKFKVTAVDNTNNPAGGSFSSYTLGTYTDGPVTWNSNTESASGSVKFTKVVEVIPPTEETATLADIATLTPTGEGAQHFYDQTEVSGGEQVSIEVSKTTSVALTSANTFYFYAYPAGTVPTNGAAASDTPSPSPAGSTSILIPSGSTGAETSNITGLDPGSQYYIDEPAVAPFPGQVIPADNDNDLDAYGANPDIVPDADDTGISVTPVSGSMASCSTTVDVTNTAAPARAQVAKVTAPNPAPAGATTWSFTLTGVKSGGGAVSDLGGGSATSETISVTANAGYPASPNFTSNLDVDGATYTITETTQTNWDATVITGDVGGSSGVVTKNLAGPSCSFTLDLTTESGQTFECKFTNTEDPDVTVIKTQNGAPPTSDITFTLKNDSTNVTLTKTTSPGDGTLDFGVVKPAGDSAGFDGMYTLCELAVPSGTHSTLQNSPYDGKIVDAAGDICATITIVPGSSVVINIDNTTPGGNALTIGYWKHWNSATLGLTFNAGSDCPLKPQNNSLADCFLPQTLGNYTVSSASQVVNVLSNPSCQYAENCLAAQLLAAELNVAAGAATCPAIIAAIPSANLLLSTYAPGYLPGSTIIGSKNAHRAAFISVQSVLNAYNNNQLC